MTVDLKDKIVSPEKKTRWVDLIENTIHFEDGTHFPVVNGIPIIIDESNSLFSIVDISQQVPQTQSKAYADQKTFKNYIRRNLLPTLSSDSDFHARYKKLAEQAKGLRVLIVGAGDKVDYYKAVFHQSEIITSDVHLQFGPDIVFDIHQIPFPDNYFGLVIAGQVLEHTVKPWQAANEMQRVSRDGGIIQIEVPFGFPYHAAPYDFFRFTFTGLRSLFSACKVMDYKATEGIFSASAVINAQALMELSQIKFIKYSMLIIGRLFFFWWKYIDKLKSGKKLSDFMMPKGYYITFSKDGVKRSDAECLKDFNTLSKS